MPSESVLATSARQAAFRVPWPNSEPRAIMVVALEAGSARILARLAAEEPWRRATFRSSVWPQDLPAPGSDSLQQWCDVIAGHAKDLVGEIADSDLVVMIGTAGEPATGASTIGETCAARAVKTSGVIIQTSATTRAQLSHSLHELRPWARTLTVVSDTEMILGMLHALGA